MSFNRMLLDYIKERYGNEVDNDEELLYALLLKYIHMLRERKATVHSDKTGFIVYKLEGDAGIIYDIYTAPNYRKKNVGRTMLNHVLTRSREAEKRVIIGFSDKVGQNHALGVSAMKATGFVPAFETEINTVFMRGV